MGTEASASLGYLRGRIALIESLVRRAVVRRREHDATPDDRFRCLYISEGRLIEELDRPFLTRPLRVPDRVTAFLLGDDSLDPLLEPLVVGAVPADLGRPEPLERSLRSGAPLLYVRESAGAGGCSLAATALER